MAQQSSFPFLAILPSPMPLPRLPWKSTLNPTTIERRHRSLARGWESIERNEAATAATADTRTSAATGTSAASECEPKHQELIRRCDEHSARRPRPVKRHLDASRGRRLIRATELLSTVAKKCLKRGMSDYFEATSAMHFHIICNITFTSPKINCD